VVIEAEDKALILLSSLPDKDYETIILTLINGKQSLAYNEVSSTLVNYELRRKDKRSSNSTLAEVLTIRGRSFSRKDKGDHSRSKSRVDFRDLKKNQCAFCKELGHWNVDYPRINDKESKLYANLIQVDSTQAGGTSQAGGSDSDSYVFSFSITISTVCYSDDSEWILDTRAIYHVSQ